ncbi:MAG: hypothetical protein WAT81_04975 [Candidatus Moraniibacteriota bacterium]
MFSTIVFTLFVLLAGRVQAANIVPADQYDPVINPADFSDTITNSNFALAVGKKFVVEAATKDGLEQIEILIPGWTKEVLGVKTLVYWDRVYVDGELVEDTRDYLAQHKNGDVWYFGENVDNYEGGKLIDHDGSWVAGINGAKPGIWIKGTHTVGDSYRQELYKGQAEDMRDVVAVGQTVKTRKQTYTDCIQMYDWTPLDVESREHKYYCPEVGAMALGKHLVKNETSELIAIETMNGAGPVVPNAYVKEGVKVAAAASSASEAKKVSASIESWFGSEESGEIGDAENRDSWIGVAVGLIIGFVLAVLFQKVWWRQKQA